MIGKRAQTELFLVNGANHDLIGATFRRCVAPFSQDGKRQGAHDRGGRVEIARDRSGGIQGMRKIDGQSRLPWTSLAIEHYNCGQHVTAIA